jgi:hypothetical protein
MVQMAQMAQPDLQGRQDQQDLQVQQDLQDLQARQDLKVLLVVLLSNMILALLQVRLTQPQED